MRQPGYPPKWTGRRQSWITPRERPGEGGWRACSRGAAAPFRSAARCAPDRSAERPADDVDDLLDVPVDIALLGGRPDAALDVVLEDEHRERVDGGAQGARLLEDVDAVLLTLDHPGDPADLALDAREPADELRLVAGVAVAEVVSGVGNAPNDTPGGYLPQAGDLLGERLHSPRMDPLDHRLVLPDGPRCTVCDERVPADRVKLLAWRDDLCFLRLDCSACLSTTLGFSAGGQMDGQRVVTPPDPISTDDVLDMHQLLAAWRGDLTGLLLQDDRGRAETSR